MLNLSQVEPYYELLTAMAGNHTPAGSLDQATADQWLHAIATKSQLFCNTAITTPKALKDDVVKILKRHKLYTNRVEFYERIFGDLDLKPTAEPTFRFIDLFAGIGGVRLGFQNNGGACVFSSEYDKSAQMTYKINHGETPFGDITLIPEKCIPDHDILLAGFPCQPFSHAGVSARNAVGKSHGFLCDTQGTLFFDVLRVVEEKNPKVIFLENVRNLESHDGGKTFDTIRESIIDLGYSFEFKRIDSSSVVPQRRIRCYMVCFRKNVPNNFKFPKFDGKPIALREILDKNVDSQFTISDRLWKGHIDRTKRNLERGTGFTAHTANLEKPSNTIVARYGKDGKECLIPQENKNPRMLTPRECARLQGFPEIFKLPKARTPAYKQFGNSVVVPIIEEIAKNIIKEII